jgi:hypothetical protein
MSRRLGSSLIALAALVAPVAARAGSSVTVEFNGGYENLQRSAFSTPTQVTNGSQGSGVIGGDVLVRLEGLGLGVSVDKTVSGTFQPWTGALMAGFLIDIAVVRLELLGELGRRGVDSFDNLFKDAGQTFVGFRPGVSFRIAPSPIRIGASGLVRWPTSNGDIGSPDYGILGRIGIEFP